MTFKKLAQQILNMTPAQQDMDVRRFDGNDGEFYRLDGLSFFDHVEMENERFPDGTPYLEA